MTTKSLLGSIVILIGLILFSAAVFTVSEGHGALKLRLGELVKDSSTGKVEVYTPGLHFKAPFINSISDFDVRLQNLEVEKSRIYTAEQKSVLVDYYAKWRIVDLPLYYTRTGGNSENAKVLLSQKINDALRAAFGKRVIADVVSGERLNIMSILKNAANESVKDLGITVTDVRIKGIELPQEVRDSVYNRMRTEREQVATKHRAQGKAKSEAIRADTDAQVVVTLAKANADGQAVRAAGDAESSAIYAKAYDKDPSFYAKYRSFEVYKKIFTDKDTLMVLSPDDKFMKYFNEDKK